MSIIMRFTFQWSVLIVRSNVFPTVMIGAVMQGMDRMLFTSLVFWLGLILIPIATLIPDMLVTV